METMENNTATTKKVAILAGLDYDVDKMFKSRGWDTMVIRNLNDKSLSDFDEFNPDFVCFTGGADISPSYYGEENTHSYTNPSRDLFEFSAHVMFSKYKKLGICRGAQLLCVANDGKMIQHVDNHNGGTHQVWDDHSEEMRVVNSVHHQRMVVKDPSWLVAHDPRDGTPEVIFIGEDKALGIQAHPEWGKSTEDYFFELIERYF